MQKKMLKGLTALLLAGCTFTMASCNTPTDPSSEGGSLPTTSESSETPVTSVAENTTSEGTEQSVIKSLTAKSEEVSAKVGETLLITSYYTITGYSSLNAAQKTCTYTSSNEAVVKITSKSMKMLSAGEAVVTVVSKTDETKTCSFKVTVKDIYFDRSISRISSEDNFDNELIDDGGTIRTSSSVTGEYYVNNFTGTKWIASTDFTIKSVSSSELFPKMGITANSLSNAEGESNGVFFFLNAEITSSGNTQWNKFGVCEVFNGGNWAWNPGVTDAVARHKDDLYTLPNDEKVTYDTKVSMTMVRDGFDFHMWVNGAYAGSMKVLEYLFASMETGDPAPCAVGFFQFNSDVIFENYSASADEAAVDAAISGIENMTYITEWSVDAA